MTSTNGILKEDIAKISEIFQIPRFKLASSLCRPKKIKPLKDLKVISLWVNSKLLCIWWFYSRSWSLPYHRLMWLNTAGNSGHSHSITNTRKLLSIVTMQVVQASPETSRDSVLKKPLEEICPWVSMEIVSSGSVNNKHKSKTGADRRICVFQLKTLCPLILTSGCPFHWETLNWGFLKFSWTPKSLQVVTVAMKLKDACSLEEKLWPT